MKYEVYVHMYVEIGTKIHEIHGLRKIMRKKCNFLQKYHCYSIQNLIYFILF